MTINNKLQYALWVDACYRKLLSRISKHHQNFCQNLKMTDEEMKQEMVNNRWETLAALKKKIEQDLADLNGDG